MEIKIELPKKRRYQKILEIIGARENNLKNIDIKPLFLQQLFVELEVLSKKIL